MHPEQLRAQGGAGVLIAPDQVVGQIDVRHAGDDDAAGVDAAMEVFGTIGVIS